MVNLPLIIIRIIFFLKNNKIFFINNKYRIKIFGNNNSRVFFNTRINTVTKNIKK